MEIARASPTQTAYLNSYLYIQSQACVEVCLLEYTCQKEHVSRIYEKSRIASSCKAGWGKQPKTEPV